MPKRSLVIILALFFTSVSFAAKDKQEPNPILTDVTARGRALYEYDQIAWHATDAVQATHPSEESMGRYIARKTAAGWTVVFGHLSDKHDKFLIGVEAVQGGTPEDFKVTKHDPPQEDTSFYFAAAKGIEMALAQSELQNRPYNVAVLPAPSNQLYVYVLPAQTKANVYPLGGDFRFLLSAEGDQIVEKRQLHKSILDMSTKSPQGGSTLQAGVHTHILTDVPEDTDVFYVLTRKPPLSEFVSTRNRKLYEVKADGNIYERKM